MIDMAKANGNQNADIMVYPQLQTVAKKRVGAPSVPAIL